MTEMSPALGDTTGEALTSVPARARIQVDGKYVKVYINEQRVVNVPNAELARGNKLFIRLPAIDGVPVMIGDISVNAGGREMYDALMADGRVVTQGTFFAVGSDKIRAESTPTLKEIGDMLKEHPPSSSASRGRVELVKVP